MRRNHLFRLINAKNWKQEIANIKRCYQIMKTQQGLTLTSEQFNDKIISQIHSGYQLLSLENNSEIIGVAGFQFRRSLAHGLYTCVHDFAAPVKDLSDDHKYGSMVMDEVVRIASNSNSTRIIVDSATQDYDLHRICINHSFDIRAYIFELTNPKCDSRMDTALQTSLSLTSLNTQNLSSQSANLIERCYPVMAQLRSNLTVDAFTTQIQEQIREGYELFALEDQSQVVCVAGFRRDDSLQYGPHIYVEDLVTIENSRHKGYGTFIIDQFVKIVQKYGLSGVLLDCGIQRDETHRFYFQNKFRISGFLYLLSKDKFSFFARPTTFPSADELIHYLLAKV